jgi:hypothetical protein
MSTIPVKPLPAAAPTEALAVRFQRLATTWRAETAYASSCTDMFAHPAYQEIIGMGWPVVPLLLEDLEKEPEHWSWALQVITGINPVPAEDSGNLDKMAKAWLRRGREKGYR